MKTRKICIITSSRADYGHYYCLLKEIQSDNHLHLQLIATGAHLSKKFGSTYKAVENDGFNIDRKLNILKFSDSGEGISKTVGLACHKFSSAFKELKPDIIVILGDRYEMIAAAIAAYLMRIPIAHIHGGETAQGAMDEAIRHSLTKMAALHFTATKDYQHRVIQMGENPSRVFNVGAPGLEYLRQIKSLSREALFRELKLDQNRPVALATYHPVTLENKTAEKHMRNIFGAIKKTNLQVVFTKANADIEGKKINRMIHAFCRSKRGRFKIADNLGTKKYVSCLKYFNLMIGNSSSGLIEAPMFKMPVVNIGDRQNGRVRAKNVIDTGYAVEQIVRGINKALSGSFEKSLKDLKNPYVRYQDGKVNFRIKEKLKKCKINEDLLKKEFFDIPFSTI